MDVCTDAGWRCVPAAEQTPVRDGLGRVTAATIQALRPAPRAACAAMDGIAIRAASSAADSAAADSAAADSAAADSAPGPRRLAASAFAWIDTGDPLPAGMDTVVERERVRIDADGSAWITGPAPRGRHVRPVGEDFQAGETLVPSGRWLRPADLAAAVAAGHTTLEVTRKPVIAIIPTGDEIQPVGSELGPGDVVDSNSVLLAARAGQVGGRPHVCDVQPDDADAIAAEVRRASLAADLVLVIAGSSVGRDDHTAAVLTHVGGLAVSKVAVRPGHPVLLGYALPRRTSADRPVAPVPVIGIPGYPLAAAVSFELFAIPLLAALQGREPADRAWRRVQLGCDWTSPPDLEEWVPVSLTAPSGPHDGTAVVATPSKGGAGAISRLARADAWWPIPVGQEKFGRGAHIDVQPISADLLLPGTEPVRDRGGPAAVGHAELGQDAGHGPLRRGREVARSRSLATGDTFLLLIPRQHPEKNGSRRGRGLDGCRVRCNDALTLV
jgi:putative molybdopterin biosynthesis protein